MDLTILGSVACTKINLAANKGYLISSLVKIFCRQSGHLLIDCPEAKKDPSKEASTKDQGGNHCFKCGSKDHTSRDCKSKRKGADAYAFATCFICKETGHLAKSCPDNPRGLYPKGGGCRFVNRPHNYPICPTLLRDSEIQIGLDLAWR